MIEVLVLDKLFCPVGAGLTPASGFQFFIVKTFCLTRMSDDEIDYANSEQQLGDASHFVWQYFAITNRTDAQ